MLAVRDQKSSQTYVIKILGLVLDYCFTGFGLEFNDVFVHGSLNGLKFVAYYLQ